MIARVAEYVRRSPPVFYALAFAGSRETGPRTLYRALALPALETHSPGEPPAELAGRFDTRTAPMVTWGGDADPAGALFG